MPLRVLARLPIVLAAIAAGRASAAQPFALELRGGASVLAGPESLRVEYLGDNDSLGWATAPNGLPYDRWVTNGTKLFTRWPVAPPAWLPAESRLLLGWSLGQNIYTPRTAHLETVAELEGDRPYSGCLAGSFTADVVLPKSPLAFTSGGAPYTELGLEVSAGTQGPWSFAGLVQHTAHFAYLKLQGHDMPPIQGWGVAETAPGLTADLSAYAETSLASLEWKGPAFLSVLGSRPGLHWLAGGRLDAGSLLVAQSVSTTVLAGLLGDPLARRPARLPVAAFLYARAEGRHVGWNASIERPVVDGTVVAAREPWVGEVAVGAVLRLWVVEVGYSQVYRTNETASLPAPLRSGQLLGQWSLAVVF